MEIRLTTNDLLLECTEKPEKRGDPCEFTVSILESSTRVLPSRAMINGHALAALGNERSYKLTERNDAGCVFTTNRSVSETMLKKFLDGLQGSLTDKIAFFPI